MNDSEKKTKASALRKERKYEEALVLYEELWENSGDNYDGWGLLYCLRKLRRFDEALSLAKIVKEKFPNDNWCKVELAWVYIQAVLLRLPETASLEKVLEEAEKIVELNPGDLALRFVVFKVLKFIKKYNKWILAGSWLEKINPEILEEKPIAENFGPRGWSYKVLWYNYKLKYLLEKNDLEEVIKLADEIVGRFPNQKKYILRFKATSLYLLGRLDESILIYSDLSNGFKPDWWILHEYALVMKDRDKKTEALNLMFRAADSNPKLELMVTLFTDIGVMLRKLNRDEDALAHYLLSRYVREKNGWKVSPELQGLISELNKDLKFGERCSSIQEAYSYCKKIWLKELGKLTLPVKAERKTKKGLRGTVKLGSDDKNFCFIHCRDKESYFCIKSNLPNGTNEGETVVFDAMPSFDAKKNKESWKAISVRKASIT